MKRILIFLFSALLYSCVFAEEGGYAPIAQGKFFSVYAKGNLDISAVLSKLNFYNIRDTDNFSDESYPDAKSGLARTIDGIYLEVSDALDIHMYDFHGTIKIVPDKNYIAEIFQGYSGQAFLERSFYFHEKNTIYVSYADLTLGMLAHEMAHAIISHYFVVAPSPKVQEILSGYVEYSLRKAKGEFR
jgi:hypothetical protein